MTAFVALAQHVTASVADAAKLIKYGAFALLSADNMFILRTMPTSILYVPEAGGPAGAPEIRRWCCGMDPARAWTRAWLLGFPSGLVVDAARCRAWAWTKLWHCAMCLAPSEAAFFAGSSAWHSAVDGICTPHGGRHYMTWLISCVPVPTAAARGPDHIVAATFGSQINTQCRSISHLLWWVLILDSLDSWLGKPGKLRRPLSWKKLIQRWPLCCRPRDLTRPLGALTGLGPGIGIGSPSNACETRVNFYIVPITH